MSAVKNSAGVPKKRALAVRIMAQFQGPLEFFQGPLELTGSHPMATALKGRGMVRFTVSESTVTNYWIRNAYQNDT